MSESYNSYFRRSIVEMAMHGVVELTMRRTNGTHFKFEGTLLPSSRECATINADNYYKNLGTTRARVKAAKRKSLIADTYSWTERVERSINLFYIVDITDFRWRQVSVRAVVDVKVLKIFR